MLANAGGGAMRSLSKDAHINQQVLILAFGEQWQGQVAAFRPRHQLRQRLRRNRKVKRLHLILMEKGDQMMKRIFSN